MSNKYGRSKSERDRNIRINSLLKKPPGKFEPQDLSIAPFIPPGMTRSFSNNRYTVMIFDDTPTSAGPAIKVMIQNHLNIPIHNHWSQIYQIKNEIFGEETVAVEYYPAQSQLLDTHNIYWIFIYPEGVLPIPIR